MEVIRAAFMSDVEEMSDVVDCAWRENYKDIFPPEIIAEYTGEKRRKSFVYLLNKGNDVFVLSDDDRLIAVCAAQTCENKPFEGYAEIMLLYVHPKHQRRGFGSRLLFHVLKTMRSKGFSHAVLETAEKNVNARLFYEKLGFAEVSRKFDDVARVIYTKEL